MKKVILTSIAALLAVGISNNAFAMNGNGGTDATTRNGGPGIVGDGEVAVSVLTAGESIVASKSYVDKQAGDLTALTTYGGIPATSAGTLVEAINYVKKATTLSAGIATELGGVNSDEINVLVSSDSDNAIQIVSNELFVDKTQFQAPLTAGKAIDPAQLASDVVQVMYDGTTIGLNSAGELEAKLTGLINESDGTHIYQGTGANSDKTYINAVGDSDRAVTVTSAGIGVLVDNTTVKIDAGTGELYVNGKQNTLIDKDGILIDASDQIWAVGNANKAVIVESDGIGVIKKSDGAISVASDGIGVKVNNTASSDGGAITIVSDQLKVMVDGTSVKVNTSGELTVDASSIVKPGLNVDSDELINNGIIDVIVDSDCAVILAAAGLTGQGHCTVSLASDGVTFHTEIVIH
ncbi:MAG: hypothetical protein FWE50_01455 [Alphaproteobacteria bacterium]|nr:hypothetical protein [Alphaproteobacteria bacterium]